MTEPEKNEKEILIEKVKANKIIQLFGMSLGVMI